LTDLQFIRLGVGFHQNGIKSQKEIHLLQY